MGFRAFLEVFTSRYVLLPALLASLLAGLWLVPADHRVPRLSPIEMVSPAQMQDAMERLNEDHETIAEFLQRQQSAEDAKEAGRAKALETAREDAATKARLKAEAASREAALKAAAQRKAAEAAQAKPAPRPAEPKVAQMPAAPVVVEAPVSAPLPITPPVPVAGTKRNPFDRAIAKANELTDKTLAAADAVRGFFVSTAEKLIGGTGGGAPASDLTSSY